MAERVYLIEVVAQGLTASHRQKAADMFDAAIKARELQAAGVRRIEIVLTAGGDFPTYPHLIDHSQEAT